MRSVIDVLLPADLLHIAQADAHPSQIASGCGARSDAAHWRSDTRRYARKTGSLHAQKPIRTDSICLYRNSPKRPFCPSRNIIKHSTAHATKSASYRASKSTHCFYPNTRLYCLTRLDMAQKAFLSHAVVILRITVRWLKTNHVVPFARHAPLDEIWQFGFAE